MKIGIVGAGNIGGTPTRRLTALGHEVGVANSRGPETLNDLAAETARHPRAPRTQSTTLSSSDRGCAGDLRRDARQQYASAQPLVNWRLTRPDRHEPLAGIEGIRQGFGPLAGSVSQVPYDSVQALEQELARVGPDNVAALFCEPVIGAGRVRPAPEGNIEEVGELCRRHEVLLVIDGVICAFGRLGTWFG